jgi:formylglycine-generating enzyme required for sulfatase activity
LNIPVSGYRLPTAKEWEYAARAGTTTDWYTGGYKTINPSLANYNAQHICKAGQFPPNPWGLYDMYGNVWEWCFDRHIFFHIPENPPREYRILRGGSYRDGSTSCSSKSFRPWEPERHGYIGPVGFRVVRGG